MRVLLAAFAIAFVVSLVFASAPGTTGLETWKYKWETMSGIALILGYFVCGIGYMLGYGFNSPRALAWSKHEFYQISITAIMLGMVIGFDQVLKGPFFDAFKSQSFLHPDSPREGYTLCDGAVKSTYSSWGNFQESAAGYCSCLLDVNIENFASLMNIIGTIGFFSGFSFYINVAKTAGISFSPFAGLASINEMLGIMANAMFLNLVQISVQKMWLEYSTNIMYVLMPLGIAFRAFSITRSAGGAMIAIAIGFYFVLPVAYLLGGEITADYCKGKDCEAKMSHQKLMAAISGSDPGGGGGFKDLLFGGFKKSDSQKKALDIFTLDGPLGPVIYMAIVSSVILPIISLIITFNFVRALALVLGADVDFSALVKIV